MDVGLSAMNQSRPRWMAATIVMVAGAATLLGAWYFQYVVGLWPCPLCLEQRVAYYFSIPLAALVLLGISYGAKPRVLQLALFAIAAIMLWNAGLGVYHAGIEWSWWPGPQECSGTPNFSNMNAVLERAGRANIPRCDVAQWRFLGISLAGYNAVISLVLSGIALSGALAKKAA